MLRLVALAAVLLVGGCKGPTPAPMPAKREKESKREGPPPVKPKFDVAPPGSLSRPQVNDPPKGFVALGELDDSIRVDMRYASADNFTGAPLPGYFPGTAWLTSDAANALVKVQADLAGDGLGLLVFDAYRPLRATKAMVRWAERTGKTKLLDDGYVARASNHNRGNTLDLTLVDLKTGKELDMGTAWDTFSPDSHYAAAKGEAMDNRKRLRKAMTKHGFEPYEKEWWHFSLVTEPLPRPRDEPYVDTPGPAEMSP